MLPDRYNVLPLRIACRGIERPSAAGKPRARAAAAAVGRGRVGWAWRGRRLGRTCEYGPTAAGACFVLITFRSAGVGNHATQCQGAPFKTFLMNH